MFYQKTILDNGLTVITERIDAVRSVSLGIWFRVGSRDESEAQQGLSHFMEHMMFKGTKKRSAFKISQDFESIGTEQNAFTSKEHTCYFSRFVDDKLSQVFDILGDMITSSLFGKTAINSERKVVLEEIARSEDTPDDYVYELFAQAFFPTHTLGRPIIGTRDTVSSFMHDDCLAFRDAHYHANNCVVTACGHIDHAELVSLCEKYLLKLPSGSRNTRGIVESTHRESLTVMQKDTEQAHLIYGLPGVSLGDDDRFAFALLETAFGGGMSSRLFQEIREKRGLAYAVYASSIPYCGTGQFIIYAGTRPTKIKEVASIIKHEIAQMLDAGLTQKELERVREFAVGHIVLSSESTSQRMMRLGNSSIGDVELLSLDEVIERYRKVDLDDINRVAHRMLAFDPTIAIISPIEELEIKDTLVGIL